MSIKLLLPVGLLMATAALESKTEVSGGVGGGQYIYHPACGPRVRVPYQEVGAEVKHTHKNGFVAGMAASARKDDPAAGENLQVNPDHPRRTEDVISTKTAVRLAPYVGWQARWFHAKLGLGVGNYYNPERGKETQFNPRPIATLGLDLRRYHLEVGAFDAPAVGSNEGMSILSGRVGMDVADHQRLTLSVGQGNDAAFGAIAYSGDVGAGLTLSAGGWLGQYASHGAFLMLGHAFGN